MCLLAPTQLLASKSSIQFVSTKKKTRPVAMLVFSVFWHAAALLPNSAPQRRACQHTPKHCCQSRGAGCGADGRGRPVCAQARPILALHPGSCGPSPHHPLHRPAMVLHLPAAQPTSRQTMQLRWPLHIPSIPAPHTPTHPSPPAHLPGSCSSNLSRRPVEGSITSASGVSPSQRRRSSLMPPRTTCRHGGVEGLALWHTHKASTAGGE